MSLDKSVVLLLLHDSTDQEWGVREGQVSGVEGVR